MKTDGGNVYKQILIDTKLKTGKRVQKTELGQVKSGGEGSQLTVLSSNKMSYFLNISHFIV
jgi:hypothetical protein